MVTQALRDFGLTHPVVAAACCSAVARMAFDQCENSTRLNQGGAPSAVLAAMGAHAQDAHVAAAACAAVGALTLTLDEEGVYKARLGELGACEAVVEALRAHGLSHPTVADKGCDAVRCLVDSCPTNQVRFFDAGVAKVLVAAMQAYAEDADVQLSGAYAVYFLADHPDTKLALVLAGAKITLDAIRNNHNLEDYLVDTALNACQKLQS